MMPMICCTLKTAIVGLRENVLIIPIHMEPDVPFPPLLQLIWLRVMICQPL